VRRNRTAPWYGRRSPPPQPAHADVPVPGAATEPGPLPRSPERAPDPGDDVLLASLSPTAARCAAKPPARRPPAGWNPDALPAENAGGPRCLREGAGCATHAPNPALFGPRPPLEAASRQGRHLQSVVSVLPRRLPLPGLSCILGTALAAARYEPLDEHQRQAGGTGHDGVTSVPVLSFGTHMSHRSVRGQRHRPGRSHLRQGRRAGGRAGILPAGLTPWASPTPTPHPDTHTARTTGGRSSGIDGPRD
jgi:hypothetical protein